MLPIRTILHAAHVIFNRKAANRSTQTILQNRGLLAKPSLRALEQSGKAIPSARQLDPLTRPPTVVGTRFRPARCSVRIRDGYSSECGHPQTYVRVRFYSSQSVAVGRDPSGAREPGTAQRPGTREPPDSCSTGGYKRVFERSLQETLSLLAIYVAEVGQQAHEVSFDHGVPAS